MDRNKTLDRMKHDLELCKTKLEEENEMAPFMIFESGQSFGELSMMQPKRQRAGTVLTLTGCFFAVIKADTYEKTLKK